MTVVWLTGVPGAGKSTIARRVFAELRNRCVPGYLLDGDEIRRGLSADLGFADADRTENVRRVAHVARMMMDAGLVPIVALVSPFERDRREARRVIGNAYFIEVYVDVPPDLAFTRDPKGMYRKARRGEIPRFTGVDSRYEQPVAPDLHLRTDLLSESEAAEAVLAALEHRGVFHAGERDRTSKGLTAHRDLNPARLPVPPRPRLGEASA